MDNFKNRKIKNQKRNRLNLLLKLVLCIGIIIILVMIHKSKENKNDKSTFDSNTATNIAVIDENDANDKYENINNEKNDINNNLQSTSSQTVISNTLKNDNLNTISNGKKDIQKKNNTAKLTKGLPVLMYHFFYDNVKYFKKDNNWLNVSSFEEQIKYLSENNFYFPTWNEVEKYVNGEISLPAKSVVITADDGDPSFFDLAVPILQKYNVTATSFVITSWYGYRYDANMKNVIFESHSDSMHEAGTNGKGRMVNWSYDKILKDVKTSSSILGNCNIFCYPFGQYNDTAMQALKDANYKLSFTTEGGRVKPGQNQYKLPRVRVSDGNSLKYFINSVN